jgi:hypothetical protein
MGQAVDSLSRAVAQDDARDQQGGPADGQSDGYRELAQVRRPAPAGFVLTGCLMW